MPVTAQIIELPKRSAEVSAPIANEVPHRTGLSLHITHREDGYTWLADTVLPDRVVKSVLVLLDAPGAYVVAEKGRLIVRRA